MSLNVFKKKKYSRGRYRVNVQLTRLNALEIAYFVIRQFNKFIIYTGENYYLKLILFSWLQ